MAPFADFFAGVLARRFSVLPILDPEFALADALLEKYAFDQRLRALDAVQIATALRLQTHRPIDYFVAADKVLCEVAGLEGFATLNPELP